MNGSTQAEIVQIEDLLRSFGAKVTAPEVQVAAPSRSWSFDSRPVIAACFALFVFAPGCAAAAVFLMRVDGTVPPIIAPDSNPPFVTKSDRLPLGQWSIEAVQTLGTLNNARLAAAAALADPVFLSPILIRGSLEDGTLTTFAEPAVMPGPTMLPSKLRVQRDVRRPKPPKLVADITHPEPPQPTFFEKLFGRRFN
ncbi:hypothetical protein [Tardiphaga sp. 813_E8_N1_3]|uniref:hypothetical protein n=1 Tax=Tardiphaga sp. 813_E8_N1_3 TaxID=3240760 RepID=UPI003F22E86E